VSVSNAVFLNQYEVIWRSPGSSKQACFLIRKARFRISVERPAVLPAFLSTFSKHIFPLVTGTSFPAACSPAVPWLQRPKLDTDPSSAPSATV
jgi:hypothetical protein